MKFSMQKDIELPADTAFKVLCDAEAYERQLLRRGVDIQRLAEGESPSDLRWKIGLGRGDDAYKIDAHVEEYQPPESLILIAQSQGLTARVVLTISALSRRASRLNTKAEARAQGVSAKVKLAALRLTEPKLRDRLGALLDDLVGDIERRAGSTDRN